MAESFKQCEFFLLRYVADAVKEEFVNIGIVLLDGNGFAEVRMTSDWRRVRCLDPGIDLEMLEAMQAEIRQRLKAGGADRERILHLLRDSFSNTVQATLPQACLTESPELELGRLAEMYLETRRTAGQRENAGRGAILARMRDAFESAGVWSLMRKRIAVATYTHKGDPLKLDCGYSPQNAQNRVLGAPENRPNGVVRFFHATSLATDVDTAKVLAFSFPQIAEGVARVENAKAELTAIVEDDLDRQNEEVAFALETMTRSNIAVVAASALGELAERARLELRV